MRPHYLLTILLLGLISQAKSASLDLGTSTSRTPYDPYLSPMWTVFRRLDDSQPDLGTVEQFVRVGRGFRYVFKKEQPYVPQAPEETEATKSGDCKAKALWLASKMNCKKVRFVVGKAKQVSNTSHAWLIWESPDGWLILDATLYNRPLSPDRLSPTEFIPTYSYSTAGKYAHSVAAAGGGSKYGDHL